MLPVVLFFLISSARRCSCKVAYRVPGASTADWVDIYNRLYRERIIFLGQEIDDELANQIIGVMLVSRTYALHGQGCHFPDYMPPTIMGQYTVVVIRTQCMACEHRGIPDFWIHRGFYFSRYMPTRDISLEHSK